MSTRTTPSQIHVTQNGGVVYEGADAVKVFQAQTLARALKAYATSKMLMGRSWTPGNMLAAATAITKKPYKKGQYLTASVDLRVWYELMLSGLPVTREDGKELPEVPAPPNT